MSISNKYNLGINLEGKKTYETVGCKYCNNTGYYERIGVFEILDIGDELKELIVKGASTLEIRNKALEGTYRPLVTDGILKVVKGLTDLKELNNKLVIF